MKKTAAEREIAAIKKEIRRKERWLKQQRRTNKRLAREIQLALTDWQMQEYCADFNARTLNILRNVLADRVCGK